METSPRSVRCRIALIALGWCGLPSANAADPAKKHLDPMAQAIVDSIRHRQPRSGADLLEAAIMAADADALADAVDFYRQFLDVVEKAGERKADLLADIGDRLDPGGLRRLERLLAPYEPDIIKVFDAARDLAGQRRRDPARLAAAAAALRDPSDRKRSVAADHLARSRTAAIPVLVNLLQTDDPAGRRGRAIARELIATMGDEARQGLIAWLGSDDVDHWPGVITALAATGDEETVFFLAPALAPDAPQAVREAALAALAAAGSAPTAADARAILASRLDQLLTEDGLPTATSLTEKTVDWTVWNPARRAVESLKITTRLARAQTAMHLARDLAVLAPTDPAQVRLVLLARLEAMTALAGERPGAVDGIPAEALREALAGPQGFDATTTADVLDEAVARGLTVAATAAMRAIREATIPPAALPVAVRQALVRAVTAPDAAVAFEAARSLAACGGDPPYPGASLVVKTLTHAASSTGVDRAVVAHPDQTIVEELAAGLARHGYQPVRVQDGRDAILAARESADTVLVMLAARLGRPSAYETTQFLQVGSDRAAPPVLVVVDPLDDDPRGKFLTHLIQSFADIQCAAIVDRLESFFTTSRDEATGAERQPRLLDAVAMAGGPAAADREQRAMLAAVRLERARTALDMLANLADRGWDVQAAVPTARLALAHEKLHEPATNLLKATGRMYNRCVPAESRTLAGDLLEPLEAPRTQSEPASADAS